MSSDLPVISISPRVRRSPFFDATRRWGFNAYTVYNHMYMPLWFESPLADYWKLVNDVTLWDVAVERQVEISGPDALRFTQLLTPRDLSNCAIGQCKYVLLCDEKGGIVNDPLLLRLDEDRFWLSIADSDVLLWARGIALNAGMDVQIIEPDVSPLQLQGPKAMEVAASLFGDDIRSLSFFRFVETTLDDIPLLISRSGWSGEFGYEIYLLDGRYGDHLWERIMTAGEPHGIAPAAPNHIRRLEAAMLSYGADMTMDNNPFEVGLGRLVNLEAEIDFIARDALQQIADAGPERLLVGLVVDGDPIPSNDRPWPMLRNGNLVGKMTSITHSPRIARNIGLAYLPATEAVPGERFDLVTPDGERRCEVVPTPFWDLKKKRE